MMVLFLQQPLQKILVYTYLLLIKDLNPPYTIAQSQIIALV